MRKNVPIYHLQELRKERGKTQEAAADEIGIATKTLGDLENEKKGPEFSVLLDIAQYYGVSIDYLAGRTDYKLGFEYEDISNITGLSEAAVTRIIAGDYGPILSRLIESDHFPELADALVALTDKETVIRENTIQRGRAVIERGLTGKKIQALLYTESLKHRAEQLFRDFETDLESSIWNDEP